MLSIKPIGRTATEVNYYANLGEAENHDYYSEDGNRPGTWWGEGASELGLKGVVNPEHFKNILEGLSPDGSKRLVQERKGEKIERRAGFDLTFSMPKSYSVAWSQGDLETRAELDKRAERAVYRTLEAFQDLCGVTRRGKNGVVIERGKLVAAVFSHDTARGLPGEVPDANRHFHAVLGNVVVREDGTTGAFDARGLFQRRMKMALGAMFRAELSKELEAMGLSTYRPKRERKDELASWFELECVPPALVVAMSKRRAEIENWLKKHGLTGAKAAEKAALLTREGKDRFAGKELFSAWRKLGREYGFTIDDLKAVLSGASPKAFDREKERSEAVGRALKGLMQTQARFSEIEFLERVAVESQTRGLGISDIRGSVEHHLETSPEIVRLKNSRGVRTFTTREMLAIEARMLDAASRLSRKSSHSVTLPEVQAHLKNSILNEEQREAVRHICSGSDVVTVTGIAGSGKTTMLSICREVLKSRYQVLGTTLAAKASRGLEDGSGIRSVHIHKLLKEIEQGRIEFNENTVLVLDEAGMVGTRLMEKLTCLVESKKGKLVLVGDHRQLQAISAGAPFRVIGERIGTCELTSIVRQKEEWARKAVRDLRDGKAHEALAELDKRGQVFIGSDREDAISRLVSDWKGIALGDELALKETTVFAGTNLEVREVNRRIHTERLAAGELGETVIELDGMEFRICDRVVVTRNNSLLSLTNGIEGEVTGVDGDNIWIRFDDGYQVEIDTKQFDSIAHSYCLSLHKGQGITKDDSLVLVGDSMTDREFSYVAGSRHRNKVRIYSDELSAGGIDELATLMNRSRQKDLAHEHLLEVG